ncbi:MAG: hypothetical protein AB1422_15600 [bacterium]
MFDKCPGLANISTPTLKIKECPDCKEEVEIFSNETMVRCKCGFIVYNDIQSCLQWCKYAKECVGEKIYNKLKRSKYDEQERCHPC